ncbi:MAG: [Fe-Fe] hydrogenase large subunit C-terminal domain-containing protein [Dorea sp.]
MKTFEELYEDLLKQKISLKEPLPKDYDPYHLDCLLHPENYASILKIKDCEKCAYDRACQNSCVFDAIQEDENGNLKINPELCVGCEECVEACKNDNLTSSKDVLPAMKAVREAKGPVYMMIAPAFLGQFSKNVTPGKLRTAFKALGFSGMVEVALFADILTLKEALEFDKHVKKVGDYQLTSCCCPVWIAMIRKIYHELMPHVPGAVSPMVACGRMLKRLHPDAITVFAGPCLAKKKEAREPDVADAVDYVLTFQEIKDIFQAADIHPEYLVDEVKEHASTAGRLYARTGGVSQAVREMTKQLCSGQSVEVNAEQANGTKECMQMIERIKKGETSANFFEGMGCVGGCVGGPKSILPKEEGRKHVVQYANDSEYRTPLENPYVLKVLADLGFETVEELLEDDSLLTRHF